MELKDISRIRLLSQQIAAAKFKTPKELVSRMGAMQAQDFYMAEWALGVRLKNSTEKLIKEAFNKGEIIRTHLMRPTWHFVSPEDIYWMLELTAPQIKSEMKSRDKELELDNAVYKKCNSIIGKALKGGNNLTREDLINLLEKANIATGNNRASHLFFRAELEGIMCSGKIIGKKQTYALLNERVPKTKKINRQEALALLAQKYFSSHCPAALQDFIWWSGLPVKDSRNALEMIKSNLISENIDGHTYWMPTSFSLPKVDENSVYVLPAYDEFIISYRDRTASLPFHNHKLAVSNNGIFRPLIVINGQVTGIWKRTLKKDEVSIEIEFFRRHKKAEKVLIEIAFEKFAFFLDKKLSDINYTFRN